MPEKERNRINESELRTYYTIKKEPRTSSFNDSLGSDLLWLLLNKLKRPANRAELWAAKAAVLSGASHHLMLLKQQNQNTARV